MKIKYKKGDIVEYKNHKLLTIKDKMNEGFYMSNCIDCFFCFENYPIELTNLEVKTCYKPLNIKCHNKHNKNKIYFKEINEMEALFLKGE